MGAAQPLPPYQIALQKQEGYPMRTPAGHDCSFYYEDFHRGRDVQECRAAKVERSAPWQPKDCARCPVPGILLANSSPDLQLTLHIQRSIFGFGNRIFVHATCRKHNTPVENPYTGCVECNNERPGLSLFAQALEDLDDDSDHD